MSEWAELFLIGGLLTLSFLLIIIMLVGFLGGFKEVEPRAEDEMLVEIVKKELR